MSARRDQILDAARDLVLREGYAQASMHAIARAAGLTRPALYAEFGDREGLFTALLDREEERVLTMAATALPEIQPGADPAEIAAKAADLFLDMVLAAPGTWRFVLMRDEALPPSAHERVARGRIALRERSEAMIRIIAAMADRDLDAELVSYTTISTSETAARLLLAEGGTQRRDAIASTLRWVARRAVAMTGVGEASDGAGR
ncbi:transcriptional regulator, TetR family [Nocardia amikacinitolerans]|uniref:TetR/AcrR family transcriptional regulator n=1 Tax=Nocardia amikacinitolerans TaxID=756689 RepID=UPI0020A38204|nr:TetR/AcrR family transcriptional regulator [Nocardia amikacinitolerans]MCP2294353.1 transcriptional regulator, TetR family [Nocardia amikacinitolerans]